MSRAEIKYENRFRITNGFYTSVMLYNPITKKNTRYPINPPAATLLQAEKFKRQLELQLGILQVKAKKRFEFLQKFNHQEKLFEAYIKHRQKVAKKSWTEDVSRMKCYVFPFFIGKLNLNHPSQWYDHWQEFQDSLKVPLRKNTKGKELAVNSKDNIIRVANTFISYVELMENGAPIKRIPNFKYEEQGQRGVESVYADKEIKKVIEAFILHNLTDYALLFLLMSKTGLRVGEAIGLMNGDVIIGSIPNQEKWIFNALKDRTPIYGYILLKSQPEDINSKTNMIKRSPLKSRKKIAPEYNRVIPLIDLELTKKLNDLKHTSNQLLFQNCTYRELYKYFVRIKLDLKLPRERDIHSLRHTFATRFSLLCDGDPRIAEKVLGHSDRKMTQRYNHLSQELESSLKAHSTLSEIQALTF